MPLIFDWGFLLFSFHGGGLIKFPLSAETAHPDTSSTLHPGAWLRQRPGVGAELVPVFLPKGSPLSSETGRASTLRSHPQVGLPSFGGPRPLYSLHPH